MKMRKFYKNFDKFKQWFYEKNLYTSVVYLDQLSVAARTKYTTYKWEVTITNVQLPFAYVSGHFENITVWDGEFHPCTNQLISSATKSEPSDKPPQLTNASFTIYKYYDIIFSCI